MIFPQCQSSSHNATCYDGAKIQFNYELSIMNYELFYGFMLMNTNSMYNLPITKYKRYLQMKDCEADELAN